MAIENKKWLSVIGIGEGGVGELSPGARGFIDRASLVVGGKRHLAMLGECPQPQLVWASPIESSIASILKYRGNPVCVLASGDPLCYGIGVTLLRYVSISEMTIIPAPSTFSLACARLGWTLTEVETVSLCGRSPDFLAAILTPNAKLLVLSADADTPQIVANLLTQRGYGDSRMTVLEHLGGERERISSDIARLRAKTDVAALNAIAIECRIDADKTPLNRLPGLPESAFHHDGQITKREVRAIALAALAPMPGELLWDVGAGCGSIGIEWLRSHPRCRAIAIEQHAHRLHFITDNMSALGTPHLQIVQGKAPEALADLATPDAIFIGGGVTAPGLLDTCWTALRSGGRLVANAVTVESELELLRWQQQHGGELNRIAIQRTQNIGGFLGWKPLIPVTQLVAFK
ncbi:bifunctional cobalt-precorrin-7 (C(5))-methyltransferase/cobalt-precorrin-6B (C(15))-methyltransferase [Chamaesiphon minutus]|uniref:Precorrin-6y C5,15-methyltransferase (Decarboxylating), CbiE subunit,precorrin-6Y C5,15-methyltransferase (Decarboxylating), CbiT subunit n=1 Tax=Chamaesiphon minutus (strain ATCC 27169 / PCC 6605) TaxID=1173020 RepID=K9UBM2_CHAP6|nr:bifunctional cobalt-precorrin-7 (C(5))-methyltransferase/cobalt-precorrin-6B (C(15))-methyltransferase [Chamaesiphon minutus]AFY92502.1 precorrin-6y C5,15-methyltransferase (decarboxylating), CbiE subunit,precorrin-6Y C5,15-methyltransferase (decarboxylating), CbiT subunit [Chamaesiphon minutus PCC 6605]